MENLSWNGVNNPREILREIYSYKRNNQEKLFFDFQTKWVAMKIWDIIFSVLKKCFIIYANTFPQYPLHCITHNVLYMEHSHSYSFDLCFVHEHMIMTNTFYEVSKYIYSFFSVIGLYTFSHNGRK
jgi:hypothetical protein